MNKLITSLLAAAVLIPTSACAETKTIYGSKNIVTKNVTTGNFNSITTTSSVDVEFRQSATQSIVISAPDNIMEYVDVKVSGKELKVGYKTPVNLVLNNTKVVVKVTAPDVTTFTTGSSGDIDIESNLDVTGDVTFSTNSSGDIEAHAIKCKNFKAQTGSSGDIEAKMLHVLTLMPGHRVQEISRLGMFQLLPYMQKQEVRVISNYQATAPMQHSRPIQVATSWQNH